MDQEEVDYYNSINLAKTKAEAQKNHYRKNPVPGRTWTPHWSHYWEPPEGSTYGSDPYLCSRCADTDQKLVPAVIRTADISGYHHAGTDAVMEKTESGWEMTEPIQEYTIADIKDAADSFGDNKTGYCKDCWIAQGNYGALEVMNKKLFGASKKKDKGNKKRKYENTWTSRAEYNWPPTNIPGNAAVIIDDSGSTATLDTGMTDKKTGHTLTRLDRHILTAGAYLGTFPDSGDYRIITCPSWDSKTRSSKLGVREFDNTDDAIDYLFTLSPSGGGFSGNLADLGEVTKDYHNVLLMIDEHLRFLQPHPHTN